VIESGDGSFVAQTGSARKMVGASMVARVWLVIERMGKDETEGRREALRNKLCRWSGKEGLYLRDDGVRDQYRCHSGVRNGDVWGR